MPNNGLGVSRDLVAGLLIGLTIAVTVYTFVLIRLLLVMRQFQSQLYQMQQGRAPSSLVLPPAIYAVRPLNGTALRHWNDEV